MRRAAGGKSMGMTFSRRVQAIQVSAIKQMPLLARSVPNAVSLGQGIPSYRTPSYIRRAVSEMLSTSDTVGKYSLQPGITDLKYAVGESISRKAGRPVDAEREIFISGGAMEALFAAFVTVIDQGDEVILFDPSYASHIEQLHFAGGVPIYVPLLEAEGWRVDLESLRRAVSPRTRAIVVCNPGNPTGKVFSAEEPQAVADLAIEHDLAVIADETYDFLVYGDTPYRSIVTFPELQDRLIACYSFSKQFAMTGWRVGYMYAPSEVIDEALKVHDAVLICAPTISQYAALAAMRGRESAEVAQLKSGLEARRELLCSRLDRMGDLFRYVKPFGAYYIMVRYLGIDASSNSVSVQLLREAGVVTIPGRAFGPGGEGHLRLSYGGTEAEINEACDRIERWMRQTNLV